jgi:glycosyltransferase involved in cell wall biosynthesis
MNHIVIIPAHNEEKFIKKTIQSIVDQTIVPKKIIVVNDNSTDNTEKIVWNFCQKHSFIELINHKSSNQHLPGQKIIHAFFVGFNTIEEPFDIISKIDADMIFPPTYFEEIHQAFRENHRLGIAGGVALIQKKGNWVYESVAHKEHVRGGFKSYRKDCFEAIGKLKPSMGWDTVDELLALFYKWEIKVLPHLQVKHMKPTTQNYKQVNAKNQASAFYKMDYGVWISLISILKAAYRKKSVRFVLDAVLGYLNAMKNENKIVSKEQGKFIRQYRGKKILERIIK